MAEYSMYTLDDSQMTRNGNAVLEELEAALFQDGLIPESNTLSKRYIVQLVKPGVMTTFFDDWFLRGLKKDRAVYKVFRIDGIRRSEGPKE